MRYGRQMPTAAIQSITLRTGAVGTFTCLNLDEAPEGPGLYAWYAQLRAGPRDWQVEIHNGSDRGEEACRELLRKHTSRFALPKLSLEAQGAFSSQWAGELHDRTLEEIAEALAGGTDAPATTSKLDETLESEAAREALLLALSRATPILAAPLYIGVATSLRKRLRDHRDDLFMLEEAIRKRPSLRDELLTSENLPNFATRATAAGLGPDSLIVYTIDLNDIAQNQNEVSARQIAEAAEWLLNRWHRPPLGKR